MIVTATPASQKARDVRADAACAAGEKDMPPFKIEFYLPGQAWFRSHLSFDERSVYTKCMSTIPVPDTSSPSRSNRANARQRAQRGETRAKLLDGAVRVFARKGYASATVDDVLQESGVSRASFYAHFPSKLALVEAMADAFVPIWRPMYDELAHMEPASVELLEDWCRRNVALYRQNETTCLVLTQATAAEPELYWKIAGYQEALIDLLASGNAALSHLRHDDAARHRAAFALSQLDQACYFLTVRASQQDPEGGISAMASQLHHFLQSEVLRNAAG